MLLKPNKVKEKLKNGEKIICAFMRIPNPMVAEIMGVCGVELIIIDCEHFQFNIETVANVIRAAQLYDVSCLVRVNDATDYWLMVNALDMGAAGIMLAEANGAQDVLNLVKATKYYPIGHRGVCTDSRASNYGETLSPSEHPKYFNDNTILAVVIENKQAVAELDDILAIPELDIVSVGDADLSYAYGRPGETNHPEHIQLRNEICEKILAANKTVLEKVSETEDINRAYEAGKRCLYIATDESLLISGLKRIIGPIKSL